MRVAAAGAAPARDTPSTLARARGLAAEAGAAGAALLVLPRRFGDGGAEASDGPLAAGMREVAAGAGVAIAYGYAERCTGLDYDAVMLVDAGGRGIANYRRAHVDRALEGRSFARGHWLSAMPLLGRKVGLLCGLDLAFPEAARALRLAGCDLLVVAGGGGDEAGPATGAMLAARAAENGCALAFASADPEASPALVLGPDGAALARASAGGALAVADVPAAGGEDLLRERRPRLYQRLAVEDGAE